MSFLTDEQLKAVGFASLGMNVLLSDRASIYGAEFIRIGNNVRIDDFCVISAGSGGVDISNYVHVAVYTSLIGAGNITLEEFSNLSSRVSIYSSNDDYSGAMMTNPLVPSKYKDVKVASVKVGRHVIIGSGSVVLPGVSIEQGAAVGGLSLVSSDCSAFGIYGGVPAKRIGERRKDLLEVEKVFQSEEKFRS
ncbi:MAG: acyltransferase [Myxococcota bacterium]|jgi:galactoside O-acetyltransferase